jgi:macrodomain Ter protein organizer (MatP/YcbG family)
MKRQVKKNNPKVTVAFRCDLTTQQQISRLSKKAKMTISEWISLVVEDALKNKVEVSKVTSLSIKYNHEIHN